MNKNLNSSWGIASIADTATRRRSAAAQKVQMQHRSPHWSQALRRDRITESAFHSEVRPFVFAAIGSVLPMASEALPAGRRPTGTRREKGYHPSSATNPRPAIFLSLKKIGRLRERRVRPL
jgi:hypothetical protein